MIESCIWCDWVNRSFEHLATLYKVINISGQGGMPFPGQLGKQYLSVCREVCDAKGQRQSEDH